MKLKISITDKGDRSVKATIYEQTTDSNVGTLYLTTEEFANFVDMLTYGISDDDTVEVEDDLMEDDNI